MCCPSYLYFFCLVVNNNINQQRPISNPIPHTWSRPQHKKIIRYKTYQRKKVIKRVESFFNPAKFCWQKGKTVGKLRNGHIKHDISFQTKNPFNLCGILMLRTAIKGELSNIECSCIRRYLCEKTIPPITKEQGGCRPTERPLTLVV